MTLGKEFRDIQREKCTFSWSDLGAKTVVEDKWNPFASKQAGRLILNHVSGVARNGEILAIMGASGAGKTSLLNLISGRQCKGVEYEGKVKINGHVMKLKTLTRLTSFVKQFEDYIPFLTVKEHLLFYARLKIKNIKLNEAVEKIDDILREFRLQKCSDSLIGLPGVMKTLSGGEYKRLVLATETISDTPILLCDEPTTGLDSSMAYDVVSALKYLASLGKVVVCTIHQPSSVISAMFDKIMLMHDGRVAYHGDIPETIRFFDKIGCPMKENTNPADFFIKCLALIPGKEDVCSKRANNICDAFKDIEKEKYRAVTNNQEKNSLNKFMQSAYMKTGTQASFWTQMRVLSERELKQKIRVNKSFYGSVATQVFVAILVAICFEKQSLTNVGAENIVGIVFNITISIGYFCLVNESINLGLQLQLVYKELQKYLYSSYAFLLSLFFIGIVWYSVLGIPVFSIMYFSGGLPANSAIVFWLFLILFILLVASLSFGFLYTIFLNRLRFITECLTPLLNLIMIANGFFLNMNSIPFYFSWLKSCNYFTRAVEAAMICLFSPMKHFDCVDNSTKCISSGDELLEKHGYVKDNFYQDVWIVVLCGAIFFVASQALFYVKSKLFKE